MKNIYCFLLGLFFLAGSAQAAPAHGFGEKEVAFPVAYMHALDQQARQLTSYLSDALHLSHRQKLEVRQIIREKLQQLAFSDEQLLQDPQDYAATTARTLQQYDAVMLRVLTPGQYAAFRWLEERQPINNLLMATSLLQR